jgi:hypothetical protein
MKSRSAHHPKPAFKQSVIEKLDHPPTVATTVNATASYMLRFTMETAAA